MKVPVFLVTGFLDAGKTTFLKEILTEEGFSDEDRTLLIQCEEGEEEPDEKALAALNISVIGVDSKEEFTTAFLNQCNKTYRPECVFIEYNGMWRVQDMLNMPLPRKWFINQVVTIVDGSTFANYLNNMRSLMMELFQNTEMVIFNRCSPDQDLNMYRRSIKAVNRSAQVVFENTDGQMIQLGVDQMPFDVNAPVIQIENEDFGLWYVDVLDHRETYEGKTVNFTGRVYRAKDFPDGYFVPGRHAMTCCAEDIRFIGFVCKSGNVRPPQNNHWMKITARVGYEYFPAYHGEGPVLTLLDAQETGQPDPELVYFN